MINQRIAFVSVGKAALLQSQIPEVTKGKLLVEMLYTVISGGTERDNILDKPNTQNGFPRILGYCGVGVLKALAEDVEGFKVGDIVLVYHGTHSKYNLVSPHQLTLVKNKVDLLEASFTIIIAMSLGGVRKLEVEIGETAAVFGQGLLGIFATQFLRLNGAYPVIAVDLNQKRRDLALSLGSDYALNPTEKDFKDKVMEITDGKGLNATVEVTGNPKALFQALECSSWLGRISLLGCTRVSDMPIDYYNLVHRPGVKLIGAHNFVRPLTESYPHHWTNQDDIKAILKLIEARRINVGKIISEVVSPIDAPSIYDRLINDKDFPIGVVFDWSKV